MIDVDIQLSVMNLFRRLPWAGFGVCLLMADM